jgi:hypothetical protein
MTNRKSKEAMVALAENDTQDLPCPGALDCPSSFSCPEYVFDSFYKPATDRLLNYTSNAALGAVQLMHDRNNSNRLHETFPAGLSQVSHLPEEDDDWIHTIEEFSDADDYGDSRKVLS